MIETQCDNYKSQPWKICDIIIRTGKTYVEMNETASR